MASEPTPQPTTVAQRPAEPAPPKTSAVSAALVDLVPAGFLLWAVYGMVRPAFDPSAAFDPIFWAVGGASLLTIYGRVATRDIEGDDDTDESFDEKYRFSLPAFLRRKPR